MRRFHYYICFACILLTCIGCDNGNRSEISNPQGSIYGCVTDFATGEPVQNANVQLRPSGETTLTGYDGMYEILDLQDGEYSLTVSKAEYTDLIDDYKINVKNGRRMRRDVQIEKIPTYIRFTDVYGNDIISDGLDFGSNLSVDMLAFNIYNNGTVTISCKVEYSCKWIKSVSEVPSSIKPGNNVLVTVTIDRSKLVAGYNETYLYITSNNGRNVIKISATAEASVPDVTTLPVTDANGNQSAWNNTFHANVTSVGNPAYHKRGFCYSSSNHNPTINDNRIDVAGTGLGQYAYTYWGFPTKTITYYVRAWVMYGTENKIQYGNVVSFTFNDVN